MCNLREIIRSIDPNVAAVRWASVGCVIGSSAVSAAASAESGTFEALNSGRVLADSGLYANGNWRP
jgi:hypothetical protein